MKTMRTVIPALAAFGMLTACAVQGTATPAVVLPTTTTTTPPTTTTTVPPPPPTHTVYVSVKPAFTPARDQWYGQQAWIDSQPWIDIPPHPGQTDCQWLHASGYSYAQAYAAWAQRGYPANWSATHDGYPCQRSYGMQH